MPKENEITEDTFKGVTVKAKHERMFDDIKNFTTIRISGINPLCPIKIKFKIGQVLTAADITGLNEMYQNLEKRKYDKNEHNGLLKLINLELTRDQELKLERDRETAFNNKKQQLQTDLLSLIDEIEAIQSKQEQKEQKYEVSYQDFIKFQQFLEAQKAQEMKK